MPETNKKVGRPSVNVNFPLNGEFGISDLARTNPGISRVTLQQKVNKGIQQHTLREVGLKKNGKGRPAKVYSA